MVASLKGFGTVMGVRLSPGSPGLTLGARMLMTQRRRAFTLIEMIAVLAVLLILAAIAVPSFLTAINGTRDQSAVLSAQALAKSIDANATLSQVAPVSYSNIAGAISEWDTDRVEAVNNNDGTITVSVEGGATDATATITLAPAPEHALL